MADEKHKMQADGGGSPPAANDPGEIAARPVDAQQRGESGGGHYPRGKDAEEKSGDFKGGQSDQAYYGHAQLGEDEVEGETHNAPSTDD